MLFPRKSLRREVRLEGFGLHSGAHSIVYLRPGDRGIRFRYGDHEVLASPENVTDTERGTKLGEIATVEHVMSALAALEITDADVELSSCELPALDGSALPFFEALAEAGLEVVGECSLEGALSPLEVEDQGARVAVSPGSGRWRYKFRSENRWPFEQDFESQDPVRSFAGDIAPARTWAFDDEAALLRSQRYGLGLDRKSVLLIGPNGYVNAARFPDEPARHKLLDLLGDLYLSGVPVKFLNVSAVRSGHRLNVQAARLLSQQAHIARLD